MSDEEAQLLVDITRANRAQTLLEDPLLKQAFDDLEKLYMSEWENSPARDTKGREKLWWALKSLKKVRGDLESHVETGKIARTLLDRLREGINQFF